jgi:hypothetical protein
MLRDFEYNPKTSQIVDILQRFGFDLANEKFPFALLRFEVITADSFMWRLLVNDSIYYIYAEDYVPSLYHVKNIFNSYLESEKWEFVTPNNTITFESASPVKGNTVYLKPKKADEMMKYTVDSGHDFVFLVKSHEDANNAQFSDNAPRGFTQY